MNKTNEINRRNRLDKNTPAELTIYYAMQEVEKIGADVRLTEAVTLLAKAKDLVADFLEKKEFTDIKTFEDACEALGIKPGDVVIAHCTPDEIAYKQLKIVVKAINQGWTPDWDNTNQRKWWPWFNLSSGFGFSNSYYYYASTDTYVGSRLCFESEEKSNYSAKQFIEMYKEFLTITK